MKSAAGLLVLLVFFTVGPVNAMELEVEAYLNQATSHQRSLQIALADRNQFESFWTQILSRKSKGAPLTLLRTPSWPRSRPLPPLTPGINGDQKTDVVRIQVAPVPPADRKANPNLVFDFLTVTGIELVVDGKIVDLNRIRLPVDTPIIDKRFPDK